MIASGCIFAVHIGGIARLENAGRRGAGIMTAYRKFAVDGPVAVDRLGLTADQQGNRKVHGGLEKAVYGYPRSGYAGWLAEFPDLAMAPGAMGENLVVDGLDEDSLHIGDTVRIGSALLQVAQIREPCSTFAAIHGTARVVRAMVRSGRCGWYYRVVEAGMIAAGDRHDVIDRPNPGWPVARLAEFAAGRSGTIAAITELVALPGLTPGWQARARAALADQRDGV